jgi:hypothetical protein
MLSGCHHEEMLVQRVHSRVVHLLGIDVNYRYRVVHMANPTFSIAFSVRFYVIIVDR